jgi:tRNA (mo5U34)-methyltransferase
MAVEETDLRRELQRLQPFSHQIDLPYGLHTHGPEQSAKGDRVASLVRHAFPPLLELYGGSLAGKRVLDVACNCGGFSVAAARAGAERVLGFDVSDRYIEQANLIQRSLDLSQVEFRLMSIDDVSPDTIGTFDVVLCFGILYHLEDPVGGMRHLSSVADHAILVDTNVTRNRFMRAPYWRTNVPDPGSETGTTGAWRSDRRVYQFTPSAEAVEQMMDFLDFATVRRLPVNDRGLDARYQKGRRATFLAVR